MKPVKLQELTINELVGRFVDLGIAQDKAELYGEISKYNRFFKEMTAVDEELRARGREARLALLTLYDHPNMQVRVKAAIKTLGVAPEAARKVLEAIRASKWQPQAMDAGMILRGLDDGEYKPD
jgi:hypothetical protein